MRVTQSFGLFRLVPVSRSYIFRSDENLARKFRRILQIISIWHRRPCKIREIKGGSIIDGLLLAITGCSSWVLGSILTSMLIQHSAWMNILMITSRSTDKSDQLISLLHARLFTSYIHTRVQDHSQQ